MAKDWTGNGNSIYKTLGASNHTDKEREENDYYATESKAARLLMDVENFSPNIWECACGELDLSNAFAERGYKVRNSDIVDRLHNGQIETLDFLSCNEPWNGDIITNPPYKFAQSFIEHALELISTGNKVAMFLKLQFLEGKARRILFNKNPPKHVYVASGRLLCAKNGDFEGMIKGGGSAVAYAWYVWEKGYTGDTVVKWIN